MGIFSKRNNRDARPAPSNPFKFAPNGPEAAAAESRDALIAGDPQRGFERAVKSVDRLHDFYVFERAVNRRPSADDQPILDGLVTALGALMAVDPSGQDAREGVREATHRLRTISTSAEERREEATRYRETLDRLSEVAPMIGVDDIYWH